MQHLRAFGIAVTVLSAAALAPAADGAVKPTRIVSMNLCVDEQVLRLTEPKNIASVTWLARENSNVSQLAAQVPINHGLAEEIIPQNPDLVLAGIYTTRAAVALLKRTSIPLMELDVPKSRRVFVNRNLRLDEIELVGFDMDYTLAIYHQAKIEELSVKCTLEKLVDLTEVRFMDAQLLRSLKPGQKIRIRQTVRINCRRSWTTEEIVGTFRGVNYLATGLATERIPEDDVVVVTVHFTKDNGELSSVTLDENTVIEALP